MAPNQDLERYIWQLQNGYPQQFQPRSQQPTRYFAGNNYQINIQRSPPSNLNGSVAAQTSQDYVHPNLGEYPEPDAIYPQPTGAYYQQGRGYYYPTRVSSQPNEVYPQPAQPRLRAQRKRRTQTVNFADLTSRAHRSVLFFGPERHMTFLTFAHLT